MQYSVGSNLVRLNTFYLVNIPNLENGLGITTPTYGSTGSTQGPGLPDETVIFKIIFLISDASLKKTRTTSDHEFNINQNVIDLTDFKANLESFLVNQKLEDSFYDEYYDYDSYDTYF